MSCFPLAAARLSNRKLSSSAAVNKRSVQRALLSVRPAPTQAAPPCIFANSKNQACWQGATTRWRTEQGWVGEERTLPAEPWPVTAHTIQVNNVFRMRARSQKRGLLFVSSLRKRHRLQGSRCLDSDAAMRLADCRIAKQRDRRRRRASQSNRVGCTRRCVCGRLPVPSYLLHSRL